MSDEIKNNEDSFEQDDVNALTEGDIIEMIGDDGETYGFVLISDVFALCL